ncbi:hypothetical protein HYD68_00900 [Mycoplasmopsis bovis]|nr:hypothetical protein [Mycoplasmopsis bovis]QQH54572.1 hypothetical protein HYD68_00900 [Mycoplasmopsis bovis]
MILAKRFNNYLKLLKEMKYQEVAIGNHEFDYVLEHMFNIEKQTAWNAIFIS